MPPPPPQVVQWLKRTYPQPTVDPEWLEGCYTWIQDELQLNPARDMPAILENVNTQLLGSDFADSMVAGTGIPQDVLNANHTVLKGPLLVEVTELMEIGHSAYSLLQVHESRVEYRKQAELRDASGDAQEQKPMPKYPRSMLQFQLSDGAAVLPAVEFKPLPQFELGETPLGYKMVIRDVTIRRGTAFLEPRCVELKGHQTADRDERREAIFLRGLKLRLGEEAPADDPPAPQPQPEPAQAPRAQPPPAPAPVCGPAPARAASPPPPRRSPTPRSPLRDISPPPSPRAGPSSAVPLNILEHADDVAEPRRRKRPTRAGCEPSPDPPPREEVLQRSRFFSVGSRGKEKQREEREEREAREEGDGDDEATVTLTGPGSRDAMKEFARTIGLSPPRAPAIDIPNSDEEEDLDEDLFASAPPKLTNAASRPLDVARARAQKAKDKDKDKEKEKEKEKGRDRNRDKDKGKDVIFGAEPSSDDYEFDFEMNDSFFESVSRAEEEGVKGTPPEAPPPKVNGRSATTQTQAQAGMQVEAKAKVKAQAQVTSQATSATLLRLSGATGVSTSATSTVRERATSGKNSSTVPGPGSRTTTVPHTSSRPSRPITKRNLGSATGSMDVIDISEDEEEIDKENVPVPTRHVRRRVATQPDTDIIELSD